MTTYSRKIETPKNMKEGLCNFVQMIINEAEAGNASEAMYKAVDLLQDLHSGIYDEAMGISKVNAESNLAIHLAKEKTKAEEFAAVEYARGFVDGAKAKQQELIKVLGI